MSLLIRKGRVVDPEKGREDIFDLLIEGERIKRIGKNLPFKTEKVIEAEELIVSPGFIDLHSHLREPGREDEETIGSGTRAGAKGGYTTLCCMPNTSPPLDDPSSIEFVLKKARGEGVIEVLPLGTISRGREGKELSSLGRMRKAGAIGFSDDGDWVLNSSLMRRALEYSRMLQVPIFSHPEDPTLSQGGVMNEGFLSTLLGLPPLSPEAEEIAIFRDLALARLTGGRLHLCHLSTKRGVELVREAKARGVRVTAEVTPHHLALTEERVRTFDTNFKVNPPLRTREDVEALKQGLKDGTIDCISTDHAPHREEEKELEFEASPFGVIGLETSLGVILKELVEEKILSLPQALKKITLGPALCLGIGRGRIGEGEVANLTLFSLEEWEVKKEEFISLSKNTPFAGEKLLGRVKYTIFRGKIVYEER